VNLVLFTATDRTDSDHICLRDHRLQHLREVIGATTGDSLRVGEVNGPMGVAELISIDDTQATLAVSLTAAPPAKLAICLVLALPRPKMLRRILRTVAELGVPELHLINSYRVEKSYWQTPVLQAAAVQACFHQGLEQARDTMLPSLQLHRRFKPFVEDELAALIGERTALLAHPGDYPPCPGHADSPRLLVIGPEGGFIPYEVEKLQQYGCSTISLGPRILRVENAVTSLLAKMSI
jgi:RsmE family RNA methyltransferase